MHVHGMTRPPTGNSAWTFTTGAAPVASTAMSADRTGSGNLCTTTQTGSLQFWEYQSTDANGALLNVSGRDPASKQLTATQAAAMRDKATVLAGWNPQ